MMQPADGGAADAARARFRSAGHVVGEAEKVVGHWMSPVAQRYIASCRHPRHALARRELPADALAWSPQHVVTWIEGLDLHG
jgi:hypothetical protein